VKVEISTLLDQHGELDAAGMERMSMVLANLSNSGSQIFIVSSGSIFLGSKKLGVPDQPDSLVDKQALSAIGQAELMKRYRRYFESYNLMVAQVLLTGDVFNDPERRNNARNTLTHLARLHVIPVINENDAVSTEDIELNDNYYLVRAVAELIRANAILIKEMKPGLYSLLSRQAKEPVGMLHEDDLIGHLTTMAPEMNAGEYISKHFPDHIQSLNGEG